MCDSKKSKFNKQQEASGLLSSLGIKAPVSKIPLEGHLLFSMQFQWIVLNKLIQGIKWMKYSTSFY